jgi:hypothetical protein
MRHLRNYSNPIFQKKIIVIIYIIPVYSLNAMVSSVLVHDKYVGEVFAIIRAMYEAVLILSFFHLVVGFLCYRENVSRFMTGREE